MSIGEAMVHSLASRGRVIVKENRGPIADLLWGGVFGEDGWPYSSRTSDRFENKWTTQKSERRLNSGDTNKPNGT